MRIPALGHIGHPAPAWLLLGVLAQLASLAAYALVVRRLLAVGGVVGRVPGLLRTTVAGIAMGASLPGGQALSTAYWYKQLRKAGAERGVAALALAGAMLAGVVSLGALFVVGVAAAGNAGPLAGARLFILAAAGALVVLRLAFGRTLAGATRTLLRRFVPALPDKAAVGRRNLVVVGGFACLNWLLDCATLVCALEAIHATVAPGSVL
ncbi:MAG: putative heme transporter, partial [Gaiellaceae bacterium]|nr:putative heme transporter [Gaiellaceae bacterium]